MIQFNTYYADPIGAYAKSFQQNVIDVCTFDDVPDLDDVTEICIALDHSGAGWSGGWEYDYITFRPGVTDLLPKMSALILSRSPTPQFRRWRHKIGDNMKAGLYDEWEFTCAVKNKHGRCVSSSFPKVIAKLIYSKICYFYKKKSAEAMRDFSNDG